MRYLQVVGLAMLAAIALATFAGSAVATILTSPVGKTLGVGAKLKAVSETEVRIEEERLTNYCEKSTIEGEIETAGDASSTVSIPISSLTLDECTQTYTILKPGKWEIHTAGEGANNNGVVTWSGAEITEVVHMILVGFPLTFHCVYYTENTEFASLEGSKNKEGKTATLRGNALISAKETDPLCSKEIRWLSTHRFETPDYLDVD